MATIKLSEHDHTVLKGRIQAGIEHQRVNWENVYDGEESIGLPDLPSRWLSLAMGTYWVDLAGDGNEPDVRRSINKILPKLESKAAILNAGDTCFFVQPRMEAMDGSEDDAADLLNDTWDVLDLDLELEAARWDSDIYSYGVVEVGWRFQRGEERLEGERGDPEVSADAKPIVVDGEQMLMPPEESEEFESETDAQAALRQARVSGDSETWGNPELDDPFVERFSPRELLVDHNCRRSDLRDARYAFRVKHDIPEHVRGDKRFIRYAGAKALADINGTVYSVNDEPLTAYPSRTLESTDDMRLVRIYDGYTWYFCKGPGERKEREHFLHVVFCDELPTPLLVEDYLYVKDSGAPMFNPSPYPFRVMPGKRVDNDSFYQTSAVEQAAPVQLAWDESWDQLNDHRRKSNRQYLGPKGALSQDQIEKIEDGEDGAYIEVEGNLKDQIGLLPNAPIQQEVYSTMENTDTEMDRALAVTQYQDSTAPARHVTATESRAIQSGGGTRMNGDAKTYRRFKEDIAYCVLLLLQKFSHRAREYHYERPDGGVGFGALDAVDLRGYADKEQQKLNDLGIQWRVKINADQQEPTNRAEDRQDKTQLLAGSVPLVNMQDPDRPGQPLIKIKPLIRMVLKTYGIRDPGQIVESDPTPEEKAQMQAQQAQAAAQPAPAPVPAPAPGPAVMAPGGPMAG
jgi:hypothetical protein